MFPSFFFVVSVVCENSNCFWNRNICCNTKKMWKLYLDQCWGIFFFFYSLFKTVTWDAHLHMIGLKTSGYANHQWAFKKHGNETARINSFKLWVLVRCNSLHFWPRVTQCGENDLTSCWRSNGWQRKSCDEIFKKHNVFWMNNNEALLRGKTLDVKDEVYSICCLVLHSVIGAVETKRGKRREWIWIGHVRIGFGRENV